MGRHAATTGTPTLRSNVYMIGLSAGVLALTLLVTTGVLTAAHLDRAAESLILVLDWVTRLAGIVAGAASGLAWLNRPTKIPTVADELLNE